MINELGPDFILLLKYSPEPKRNPGKVPNLKAGWNNYGFVCRLCAHQYTNQVQPQEHLKKCSGKNSEKRQQDRKKQQHQQQQLITKFQKNANTKNTEK